jgi:ATP-dependent DNA ligase
VEGWSFEPKYDGFRAVISTEKDIRVRSRRGWEMGPLVPELQHLPTGLVLDGELVAWKGREPYFPALCRRVLNGDTSIPVTYVVFDLLGLDGTDLTPRTHEERRFLLEELNLGGPHWQVTDVFDDGHALYTAVCELGLEGVVAKRKSSRYGVNARGWIKVKNPGYWRRESEIEAVRRSAEKRSGRLRGTPRGNRSTMAKGDVHVVPSEQGWRVEIAADGRAKSVHRTQEEAREAAREIARRNKRELFVHGRDGQIRERNTYGRDPRKSQG